MAPLTPTPAVAVASGICCLGATIAGAAAQGGEFRLAAGILFATLVLAFIGGAITHMITGV